MNAAVVGTVHSAYVGSHHPMCAVNRVTYNIKARLAAFAALVALFDKLSAYHRYRLPDVGFKISVCEFFI